MTLDECLARFGWPPRAESVVEIRGLLQREAAAERASQGGGDTELMRLLCALLFATGDVRQAELIWRAKTASMDADCSIDIQLLCGGGLAETRNFLRRMDDQSSHLALERLAECEAAGDFDDFSPAVWLEGYREYYLP